MAKSNLKGSIESQEAINKNGSNVFKLNHFSLWIVTASC